ncbi:FAD synthetase family protein [Paraburkholderia sp. CNPSo 3274]|uniref:FAD synthetase family protein n=1 Tax=Paraburkholderia sp. CNPSo 3274 TaxID=2940932 RepID=UPI0020B64AC5|nr:FAD synthetase family protein [Paraburkholderia sp. CNPSo 3274]MCP3713167.1 FAD synthetase family protein [Paraburkholderia sp. CNPSo 3274]
MNLLKQGCVISIGVFDGVHGGHRRVLQMLRETAKHRGLPAVVVTFDPHPRSALQPDRAPPMLVSVQRRLELLESTGCVERTFLIPFDQLRREQSADDFVRDTLIEQLGMRALVVGANFVCGKGRVGSVEYLTRLGKSEIFSVHPVPLHAALGAQPASSTVIRRLILDGDLRRAAQLLGRHHELECKVGSGRELLLPMGMCVPHAGRYCVLLRCGQGAARQANVFITSERGLRRCFAPHADFEPGTHVTVQFVEELEMVRQEEVLA